MKNMPRALIVEDDRSWQQILSEILTDCGLLVDTSDNLEGAIQLLKDQSHRLAIVDLSLSPNDHNNYDGLRVLEAVRRLDPNCRTILLTGFATVELAVTSLTDYNAFTFLRKENFQRTQFRELVYRALASIPLEAAKPVPQVSEKASRAKIALTPVVQASVTAEKAIVVEDDAGWRNIIEELLVDAGYKVLACSGFGEALGYLNREKYSIAVVDLSLSDTVQSLWGQPSSSDKLEGFQLLETTHKQGTPTIVVSGVASTEYIKKAYSEESIFAFLEKQSFSRSSFMRIIEDARNLHRANSELNMLTDREREVFDQLAQGLTNKEIAENLVITTNTVKRHIKAIFEKLGVHTRSAAAAKAVVDK